jgi:iron complex outermembrane receptor protein
MLNSKNMINRKLEAMKKVLLSLIISCVSQAAFSQDTDLKGMNQQDFSDDFGWEEDSMLGEEIPMVLTASRLKQPKAEVPASVTVISSEQIKLWGVRTLPDLMKFVPGMFVGHTDNDNNASVAYHTSNPNIMRRLQVLVDGRSVYKSAIATVVWDDIGLAIEDIDRIEVTRGPNAALYGANSYLGVINVLTKHPEDGQGTLVSWRKGNKGTQDVHFRHGLTFDSTSLRISGSVKADEGFDGLESTGSDALRDGRKHGFINAYINHELDDTSSLDFQVGYKSGKTEMRKIDFDQKAPDKTTKNGYVYARWQKEFSAQHQSHLQFYWQKEERKQDKDIRAPTLAFEQNMVLLHKQNSDWADIFAGIPSVYEGSSDNQGLIAGLQAGVISTEFLMSTIESVLERQVDITQQDLDLTKVILDGIPDVSEDFSEMLNGKADTDLAEQRIDIEWQDTMRWSDDLRTVSGLSYRQDAAYSQTYFNGNVNNDTWRAFINAEYRIENWLILNTGGMYEYETHNDAAFSPRLAANFLIDPQQSIRVVASQAVRSPDLLESQPEFIVTVSNIDENSNYLNKNTATFYQQNVTEEDEEALKQEKITSYEIGYFVAGSLAGINTELDLKVFHEEMRDMISDAITLQATDISNDNEADVDGAELQFSSRLNDQHSLWLTYSYLDVDNRYVGDTLSGDAISDVEKLERRLSSENSTAISWMYNSASWAASLSYFNQDSRHIDKPYERFQLNLVKPFVVAGLNAELSYYIQHNRQPKEPLNYRNQIHSSPNIFYGQLAIEF